MDTSSDVLAVPTVSTRCPGLVRVRTARQPDGERVAMAFGTSALLAAVMGEDQAWVRLSLPALHAMLAPIGVTTVVLDPVHVGPVRTDAVVLPFRAA